MSVYMYAYYFAVSTSLAIWCFGTESICCFWFVIEPDDVCAANQAFWFFLIKLLALSSFKYKKKGKKESF